MTEQDDDFTSPLDRKTALAARQHRSTNVINISDFDVWTQARQVSLACGISLSSFVETAVKSYIVNEDWVQKALKGIREGKSEIVNTRLTKLKNRGKL